MVPATGVWGVPASVVSGLVDGSYPVSVSVTDKAGNTGSQSLTVTVDTAAPMIGINTIAGDDVINASEKGADVQITGTSDQPVNTATTVTAERAKLHHHDRRLRQLERDGSGIGGNRTGSGQLHGNSGGDQ